jgi:hypothetical protein
MALANQVSGHQDATPTEEAKVLIPKSRLPRFGESLVHLALLTITPYILSLNFRYTYWSDTGASNVNTKLEAFQFAAKLYEILICASLASTTLYLLRRALWSSEGVSLGSLVSSYGFGDISIFLSPALWGGLVAVMQPHQQPRHFALGIFLVLAIFMAAVAGPSAAIILIPQLGWWPRPYNASLEPFWLPTFFLNASTASLWPQSLNKSHLPNANCLAPTAVQNSLCPAGGYPDIFEQTRYTREDIPLNISISAGNESPVDFSRSLIGQEWYYLGYGSTVTSTQSHEPAGILWDAASNNIALSWEQARFAIADLNGQRPLKPVVQVQCEIHDTALAWNQTASFLSIQFPYAAINTPPFQQQNQDAPLAPRANNTFPNIYQGQNWTVNISSIGNVTDIEDYMRNGSLYFTWVDLSQYDIRPSIAAAIFIPSCNSSVPVSIAACSVDARWLPIDIWVDPSQSESIFDSYPNPLDLISSLAGEELEPRPLEIGIDWAMSLNVKVSESSSLMESLLHEGSVASACEPNATVIPTQYYQDNLALALADGLARVGCGSNYSILWYDPSDGSFLMGPDTEFFGMGEDSAWVIAAVSNWTRLDIALSRYGYGYGMSTVTKKFAAAVLLGQAVIAIAIVAALALSKGISSSWSSSGELLALAINSNPTPRLQNTGAGVSPLDTWKEKVTVRVADGKKLEMIFEGDKRLNSEPKVSEKYAYPSP